ncbi:MAG: ABC transporter permease subunit [Firmicutes bacterium]|nr:ABC transporter permease subunit [Bacillota bacterium]
MNQFLGLLRSPHRVSWADFVVAIFLCGVLFALIELGRGMVVPLPAVGVTVIHLSPLYLPYYAGRSLLRMFIAYFLSLAFSLVYGRIAAYHKTAEKIMIPALDLLQSIPVFGFLTITITAFLALFPGNQLGAECASIFAIFTAQAWNITFSFYHSLTTIPQDLIEAAEINRLRPWARFTKLEVPYSMIGLVYNSMMSFGGAWFFLIASESFTVLNKTITLPGIGSYLGEALARGDVAAVVYGLIAMTVVIVLVDQLVWRPAVAWSYKFKLDQNETADPPSSWFLQLLRRTNWLKATGASVWTPVAHTTEALIIRLESGLRPRARTARRAMAGRVMAWLVVVALLLYFGQFTVGAVREIADMGLLPLLSVIRLGFYTFLRVMAATILGALWTIPLGVAIGLNPRLARIMQPLVQLAASYPTNVFYPIIGIVFLALHVNFNIGAVPLIMLGTQWYILFNVIAGAMAIPSGLKEASSILRLRSVERWKTLILPAIFPALITGGITASGGAWNASVLAEMVVYQGHTLIASGLGAYIDEASSVGNWAHLIWGLVVMSTFVVTINRLIWRRLYRLAETKFHLD